jgi:hypothetical protein
MGIYDDNQVLLKEICLEDTPNMLKVYNSLRNMVKLSDDIFSEEVKISCPGEKFVGVFEGQSFVVCKTDIGFKVLSPDFEMTLNYIPKGEIAEFKVVTELSCPKSHYEGIFSERNTNIHSSDQWFRKKVSTSFPEKTKDCIFLHGSGVRNNERQSQFIINYWGNIQAATQQCKSHSFIQTDTFHNAWNDPNLLTQYCNISTWNQDDKYLIRDKLIFTHSMGNLIFGQALMEEYCDMDISSRWYAASAPLNGSRVALVLAQICAGVSIFPSWVTLEFCTNGEPEPSYASMKPNSPGLDLVRQVVTERSSGSMCGLSAKGLNTIYSVGLVAVGLFANLEAPNDGLVAAFSCLQDQRPYDYTYKLPYYQATINHADGTCRNGDSWFGGEDKRPCSWYGAQQ